MIPNIVYEIVWWFQEIAPWVALAVIIMINKKNHCPNCCPKKDRVITKLAR